jgi:hypothetical protein
MNTKFTLAIIALIGIGVFALPSTMSLFAGQHSFYNIDATGNQIPCTKCHGDVKSELSSNANTNPALGPLTAGPHAAFKCEYCHRIEQGSASGDNAYMKLTYKTSNGAVPASIYMITTVKDAEAHVYPDTINGTPTVIKVGQALKDGTTFLANFTSFNISFNGTLVAGSIYKIAPPDVTLQQTYNWSTGLPLDTNITTMNTGLSVSVATISTAGVVNLDKAGSKSVNPGAAYHAASLVSCMECHGGEEPMGHYTRVADNAGPSSTPQSRPCSNCHYGGGGTEAYGNRMTTLQAGGFNLTGLATDTGAVEAHNQWVKTAGVGRFAGPNGAANNDACVACHTHVAIDINFKKGYKLELNAIENQYGNYAVSGSKVVGTVDVSVYGNSEGTTFAVSNKTYNWTPTETLYINGSGAQVLGLNGDSSDNATALTT